PTARRVADNCHILCANSVNELAQHPPSGWHHVLRSPTRSQRIDGNDAVRIRLLDQIANQPPVATNNLVNIGAAVQEDCVMSSATTSGGLHVIYRPAFVDPQINLNVVPQSDGTMTRRPSRQPSTRLRH